MRFFFIFLITFTFTQGAYSQILKVKGQWKIEKVSGIDEDRISSNIPIGIKDLLSIYSLAKDWELEESSLSVDKKSIFIQNKKGDILISNNIESFDEQGENIILRSRENKIFIFKKIDEELIEMRVDNAIYILSRNIGTILG